MKLIWYLTDTSTSSNVLKEVGKLRELDYKLLPSRRSLRTSTTHHVPPYGMFKQSREKDIDEELKASSGGIKRVTTPGGEWWKERKSERWFKEKWIWVQFLRCVIDKDIHGLLIPGNLETILMLLSPPPKKKKKKKKKKHNNNSGFWSPPTSPQTHYETMSNCSQNCWIIWNSAVLCFKWLFHIGVWTFVHPLLATILCVWENLIWFQ